MSIAALAVSDVVVAGQAAASTKAPTRRAPKNRTITANSDAVAQPEAR
jgi:hypothetical protein